MGLVQNNNQLFVQVLAELEQMQPYVQSHGGQIELIEIENYNVIVRLKGACDTCPLSFYTITYGLESKLQLNIDPKLKVIIQE